MFITVLKFVIIYFFVLYALARFVVNECHKPDWKRTKYLPNGLVLAPVSRPSDDLEDEISGLSSNVRSLRSSINDLEERAMYDLLEEINNLSQSIGEHQRQVRYLKEEIEDVKETQEEIQSSQEAIADALYEVAEELNEDS